jgi:hypothetical protein
MRVFCGPDCDWAEGRPEQRPWLEKLWKLIEATPHLDWQLLTKRPQFSAQAVACWLAEEKNVWLGINSGEPALAGHPLAIDQKDPRGGVLSEHRAAVRAGCAASGLPEGTAPG